MSLEKTIIRVTVLLLSFGLPSLFAAITGSKHDMQVDEGNKEDLCVYCHTPNGINGELPPTLKWDKAKEKVSFKMYNAGSEEESVNSQSMACLGCHDGVSAVNAVPNISSPSADNFGGAEKMGLDTGDIGNHPISIKYTEGKSSLRPSSANLNASSGLSWAGATTISDLLRGSTNDKIECGSCHDPHMGENPTFLRVSHNASNLCFGCHSK